MAHKKGGGTSRNGRDSGGQRLGMKVFGGQEVKAGGIIYRQHGSTFYPGTNAGMGSDFTIFAKAAGKVVFESGRRISVYAERSRGIKPS